MWRAAFWGLWGTLSRERAVIVCVCVCVCVCERERERRATSVRDARNVMRSEKGGNLHLPWVVSGQWPGSWGEEKRKKERKKERKKGRDLN